MTWPVVTDTQSAVQLMMGFGCTLIGLSHMLQPRIWQDYFAALHKQGEAGVLTRTMTWELWPALVLVTLHQVWRGPAVCKRRRQSPSVKQPSRSVAPE
jgi:hypothetical protein